MDGLLSTPVVVCVNVTLKVVAVAVLLRRNQVLRPGVWPSVAQVQLCPVQVEGSRAVPDVEARQTRRRSSLLRR